MTSGRRELPDICVPRVFHKPLQLLCIVSGETGSCCFTTPSLSWKQLLPWWESCPTGRCGDDELIKKSTVA